MANCSYCGTKLDDNAKFCTACGAAVEQTAPAQEAPAQGSYTAPQQGSYTAPTQGTYTPAQSYTPPAQPTAAAADRGSYTPPVQNSVPGGNYEPKAKAKIKMPGMPQMPKGAGGKKRLMMLGGIAVAVILLIALVSSCGGGGAAADDPNLGVYNAVTAEMWGMEMPITDMFENGVSIELKEKGKCEMNFDGTSGKGKWTLEDGVFYAEAGGAELNGTLANGVLVAENVLDMGVNLTFEKEGGYVAPVPEEGEAGEAAEVIEGAASEEPSALQQQWNGTWFGTMYVYEAEGDFSGIPTDDVVDCYMVVDVDSEGKGTFKVYFDGVFEEPYAVAECTAYDYGMDAKSGTIVDMLDMEPYNWMFRPVPDYPDRYTVTDSIEYDDSLFEYTLFFKQWGKSWQDEIDSNFEIVPYFVEDYETAIANGEMPPVGFAPIEYAGQVPAVDDVAEEGVAVEEVTEASAGSSGFGGEHTATIAEFMTDIPADFTFTLPERGWVLEVYSDSTIYLYNVPTPDDAYSNSPRIQFELKENLDKINFYKDDFENLKEIDSRTIGGIEMTGRTYKNVGMDWIEYYGELPSGVWVTCKISDVDISAGTEGAAILDSVSIK